VLERIEPSVAALIDHIDAEVEEFEPVQIDYIGAAAPADHGDHGAEGGHGGHGGSGDGHGEQGGEG
jgi:hypothetical protein